MRFKRNKENEPGLGIAPLVDIVFLLLIFFMLTSHFDIASGIRIRLPKAAHRVLEQEKENITLVMDSNGTCYLKGKKIEDTELRKKLHSLVEKKDLIHLVLQADKEARHGRVVQIMDLAKSAGIRSIIIAARMPTGGG
ncbi:MAG: biopolymer transporter ExbD [Deltaproteobacteria bacterium]|nr:biopolymer transporter ExbD [Deltaproteobacteria bacterium]